MFTIPPTLEQVAQLQALLVESVSQGDAKKLKTVLPAEVLVSVFKAAEAVLRNEPSLVELSVGDPQAEVFVFGDTHGHFPDVAYMLNEIGYPSPNRIYVFNGDYVDRGSWGVELLAVLCALKCAAPSQVYLLRGNHESSTCTKYYGYYQEVRAKYEKQAKDVYTASKKLFTALPLAALIQGNTLVMHGGLFRRPPEPKRGAKRRKPNNPSRASAAGLGLVPGSLDDLRRATKGGMDPDGTGASLLATDVLWSDPVAAPGFRENDARGVGLIFGPDVTEAFLTANGLRLIIRSHEGPDARDKRSDLPQVLQGYSVDHNTPAGQLVTVFSAPDYPQFQAVEVDEDGRGQGPGPGGSHRYENLAAVAVLSAPDYATPNMRTFEAVKPRPKADAYYDYATCCDSDAELADGSETMSPGPSGAASDVDLDLDGDEVQGPSAAALQDAEAAECTAAMAAAGLQQPEVAGAAAVAAVGPPDAAAPAAEGDGGAAVVPPEAEIGLVEGHGGPGDGCAVGGAEQQQQLEVVRSEQGAGLQEAVQGQAQVGEEQGLGGEEAGGEGGVQAMETDSAGASEVAATAGTATGAELVAGRGEAVDMVTCNSEQGQSPAVGCGGKAAEGAGAAEGADAVTVSPVATAVV